MSSIDMWDLFIIKHLVDKDKTKIVREDIESILYERMGYARSTSKNYSYSLVSKFRNANIIFNDGTLSFKVISELFANSLMDLYKRNTDLQEKKEQLEENLKELEEQLSVLKKEIKPLDDTKEILGLVNLNTKWLCSIGLLVVTEIAIKRKLDEFNVTVPERIGFFELFDKFKEELTKRNIKPSLIFDLVGALRQIRNKLLHEGYEYEITDDEFQVVISSTRQIVLTLAKI